MLRDAIEMAIQEALTITKIKAAWKVSGWSPFDSDRVMRNLPKIWPPPKPDAHNVGSPRDVVVLSPKRLLPDQTASVDVVKTAPTEFVKQVLLKQDNHGGGRPLPC